jgi:hypothetical protein
MAKTEHRLVRIKNWLFISGGIGVAFIFLSWWLSCMAEAEELRRENQSQKAEIEDIVARLSARDELIGLQELFKKQAPEIIKAVGFGVDFPPTPKDISEEVFLKDEETKRRKVFEKTLKRAATSDPSIVYSMNWDLGNRIKNKMTEDEIEEMKARIVATDYLVNRALECGITRLNQIVQTQRIDEPLEKLERVIVRYPITLRVSTKLEPLVSLLFSISLKNRFLQILELTVEQDIHSEGFLQATIVVAVVRMTEMKAKEGAGGAGEVSKDTTKTPPKQPVRRRY